MDGVGSVEMTIYVDKLLSEIVESLNTHAATSIAAGENAQSTIHIIVSYLMNARRRCATIAQVSHLAHLSQASLFDAAY